MSFFPQSRIVRDLLWIGFVALAPGLVLFYTTTAFSFLLGGIGTFYGLGWLSAAIWVEFRLRQVQKMIAHD